MGSFSNESKSIFIAPIDNFEHFKSTLVHEIQHVIQHIEGFAKGGNVEQYETVQNEGKIKVKDRYYDTPFDAYKSLAGEVEARNVETRMNMSADERRKKLLQETADVNTIDQIVLFQSDYASVMQDWETEKKSKRNEILFQEIEEASKNIPEKAVVNRDTFFKNTYADWEMVKKHPDREPDYKSSSGSEYWYEKEGVYRRSNHWGNVASCWWLLNGNQYQSMKHEKDLTYAQSKKAHQKEDEIYKNLRYSNIGFKNNDIWYDGGSFVEYALTGYAKWEDISKKDDIPVDEIAKRELLQNVLITENYNKRYDTPYQENDLKDDFENTKFDLVNYGTLEKQSPEEFKKFFENYSWEDFLNDKNNNNFSNYVTFNESRHNTERIFFQTEIQRVEELFNSEAVEIKQNYLMDIKDDKTLRENAKAEYKKLKTATTKDGKTVLFTGRGFKEVKSHSRDKTILYCVPQLKELVENSIFLFDEIPDDDATIKDTKKFYNYGVKIFINGEDQFLRITVRETNNNEFFYDAHNTKLIEIKKELANSATRIANPLDTLTSLSKDKLIQFLLSVKQNNPELDLNSVINKNFTGQGVADNTSGMLQQITPAEELENIRKQYENTDKWLKAPNGNDTNLTEKQWLQVRTPQFKEWFGDWENNPENASKVVDENGEPLVVYHGTGAEFDVFGKETREGENFHFGTKEQAELRIKDYIQFIEADINRKKEDIKNANSETSKFYTRNAISQLQEQLEGFKNPKYFAVFLNIRNPKREVDENLWYKKTKEAKTLGYDGFVYYNVYENTGDDSYAVFSPGQIKSATNNSGEFNTDNPSILFQTVKSEIKEKDIKNIKTVTEQEFEKITENLYSQEIDQVSLPNLIQFPDLNLDLQKALNIKGHLFITKKRLVHINPQRKQKHSNEQFRKEEVKQIPNIIKTASYALKENNNQNNDFIISFLDEQDKTKVNLIIFTEDKNGNLLTTIKKKDLEVLRYNNLRIVGAGVEPAISSAINTSSTTLTTSPTNNFNVIQNTDIVNNKITEHEELDRQYFAAIEAGDMETVQRLVNEQTEKKGYNDKYTKLFI